LHACHAPGAIQTRPPEAVGSAPRRALLIVRSVRVSLASEPPLGRYVSPRLCATSAKLHAASARLRRHARAARPSNSSNPNVVSLLVSIMRVAVILPPAAEDGA
jgi:hypothetical protein